MTQKEFTNRTNVEVSYKEFEAIHEVYVNSDMDKNEFCEMWKKMNKSRVEKSQMEAQLRTGKEAQLDFIWSLIMEFGSVATCDMKMHETIAADILSEGQQDKLASMGIDMRNEPDYYFGGLRTYKNMGTILYEVGQILEAA